MRDERGAGGDQEKNVSYHKSQNGIRCHKKITGRHQDATGE